MHDEDKTDRLAKAIEEMVQGHTPEDVDDEELQELLQIARIRLDAAGLATQAANESKDSVLDRLTARLDALQKGAHGKQDDPAAADDHPRESAPDDEDPENTDVSELQDIISLRRRMAEEAAALSETYQEAVWQRVQARVQAAQSEKRGLFRWPFGQRDRDADDFGAALDRMTMGEPIWEAQDSRLGELLNVARIRRAAATKANADLADKSARVWAHLRPRLMARLSRSRRPRFFQTRAALPWPKLAAAAAGLALVVAALGPIPATGLAHHPAAEFARFLGDSVGVTETSAPPAAVPPVTEVVESRDVSTEQASTLVGMPVHEPTFVPGDYRHVSSQYFSQAITADEGGVYVITYEDSNATESILIYQERTSANSIAVARGFSQNVWLSEGAPATYVSGTWRSTGSDLSWGEDDGQTIVFDLGGVRTVIYTTDGDLGLPDLVAIADGLASQAAPPTN